MAGRNPADPGDLSSLDPHAARLLAMLAASAASSGVQPDLLARRKSFSELMRLGMCAEPVARVRDFALDHATGSITLREFVPESLLTQPPPALLYLHGGGLMAGDLDTHDALCRALANGIGCAVIAIGYRLAPEHPFPAAIEDALAAMRWCVLNADALGIDSRRIAIGGDSAGAHLAAVACQQLCQGAGPRPLLQLLLCPILDLDADTHSRRRWGSGYLLEMRDLVQQVREYLPGDVAASDYRTAPLRAGRLHALPATLIHAAQFDPMRDEAESYAARLREAGVDVHYTCHAGMIHLFYALGAVIPYAKRALVQMTAQLRPLMSGGERP